MATLHQIPSSSQHSPLSSSTSSFHSQPVQKRDSSTEAKTAKVWQAFFEGLICGTINGLFSIACGLSLTTALLLCAPIGVFLDRRRQEGRSLLS